MNVKLTPVGGMTKAARIRDAAQALGLEIMIDEPMRSGLAAAATACPVG